MLILAYLHSAVTFLVFTSGRVLAAVLVAGVLARIVYRIVAAPTGNLGLVLESNIKFCCLAVRECICDIR